MITSKPCFAVVLMTSALVFCACSEPTEQNAPPEKEPSAMDAIQIQYLEIVTPEMDATCAALEKLHGVSFGEVQAELGNARTAPLKDGGRVSVRVPMHDKDGPVVRPYVLVDDIEAAVRTAEAAGGEIALPSTEIPGQGKFAIYFLGGIEHGLWQN